MFIFSIVDPFDILLKNNSQKSNLLLDNKNLKWGKISLWNKCFSKTHWPQLTTPFYSILFETSIWQFNSSKCITITPDEVREHLTRDQRPFLHPESLQIFRFTASSLQFTSLIFYRVQVREHLTRDQRPFLHPESLQIFRFTASSLQFTSLIFYRVQIREHLTRDQRPFLHPESLQIFRFTASLFSSPHSSSTGFRSENTWHEIRDHSFIQNHSRSSDSQLLSSVHLTHLLQGSDQRTPDKRSETIPSSRITPDLQIHSFSSSVHSLIFYRVQVREHLTRDQRPFLHPESLQILQIHSFFSSVHSLIFYRVQVREHLTRDQRPFLHPESLQILQIHSFFSSVHSLIFYRVQDQRTPDTRSETIPSSRITPDLQIHSFFSSVHSLIFYRVQVREHLTRDQRPFLHPESLQIFRFTASSLQFTHSSSTGFRSENTWHEIRDHSFIQNHSRSSDSQLLLFSSPHSSSTGFRIREHLTRDQRPFLHPESLQIFRFTASSLQFTHSSSTGFRSENTWHEIRDHSFIQNHSRSSDSQLLLFSSPHSSSTGFRSENTWHEIRDHSFIQNHSRSFRFTASSLQFTSLIFYRVQVREHLTRDQRPFLHPESLQIFRFTASSLQFTSLIFYRVQVREHLTRDQRPFLHPESLQIFRFTASSLQFTSLIFYRVQDQRTPDTRSETIPSSRITPDLQIHSFSSSVHLIIFYRVQIREHLTRDQRPFLHPESLQIFRFTASSLQFTHSSSTGFRSENTWHEIRDHSFIQNHSRSSDSQLLLFSSLTHLLQGSDQRTPDTRSETIPSSRITPDLQIHSFFSSVHLTHLLQGSGQRTPDTRSETIPSSRITPDLQIHSFFSSVHLTHLLQGSDQRTPDTRSETIPSSRITPDLQIHSFFSSVHSLIFYRVQIREHLTRDQRPFLHPESLQIFRFTASSLQFTHSSSTGFRSENTWHEIRDHSFIQNHSRSSDSQLLLFSSLTHLLQGSDQRTPDTRSETIPSSRITPDLQIHSFFSSVHSLIFYRVQIREHLTRDQRPFLHPESLQIFRFTASSLQFTSLIFYRVQDQRTPDTRSETIPSSRITPDPSDSQLLLFSSLTHLLQGSDQRTPDTRSETIPSSRITPDLQIHSFFSSVHSLIFYRVQIREHLTRDQRPFLHPESLQIFRFTASSLQFTHSSSTGFRSENTWHEIRDHSFIQNHSRSSDSQLLLFSSLTHLLQGSDQRTPDTRSETIPSSRITPDLQIHSFFSSVHSLIFYRVQIREHLTRDQRPFLHPESLQIFRFTASPLQFTHSSSTGFRSENTWHEIRDHSFIQNHSRSSDSQLLLFSSPHSSSTGFRSENTWHEIRDHSFIQNHSRSSDSQLLLFSSLTHLLQGSGQRTPDTRSETIPSSRITPDLQIHSFSSSVHSLIFYRVQVREHLTRDQRPFLHPESLQIFRFTASSLQFTSLIFYRVQIREHLTRDQRPFLHPESLQIFRFTASSSSVHSSSTGFRSENTWHEIRDIPSSRITPDLQIHSFFSSVQFTHSSSTGFRSENPWHEIRDHSFIQNHSRSSDSQLLLFSSLTHLLQGSDQRTPDTRSETIPSSRITPDLQIHSFSSSVHLTHLLQGSGQRTPDTRSETIPSSRITPDLQIHSFFSSVHSLIFYRVQIRGLGWP